MNKISRIQRTLLLLVGLLAQGIFAHPYFPPANWSPDSRYLAILESEGNENRVFPPLWIFGNIADKSDGDSPISWRIWLYDRQSARSFSLEKTDGYLSAPCWSASGDALIFVHFTPSTPTDPRSIWTDGTIELVRHRRSGQREILHRESGRFPSPPLENLAGQAPDCSSDGRWISAPWLGSSSVILYDLKYNSVARRWSIGSLPQFSPRADRLATWMPGPIPRYAVYDLQDAANPSAEISTLTPHSARWDRTGSIISAMLEQEPKGQAFPDFGAGRKQKQFQWMLYRTSTSNHREVLATLTRGSEREDSFSIAEIDLADRKGEIVVNVSSVGSGAFFEFLPLRGDRSSTRWHPLDTDRTDSTLLLGVPRYSPDETMLSFRFGFPSNTAPLGIIDPQTRKVAIVANSMDSKLKALWGITFALDRAVRDVGLSTPGLLEWTEPASTRSLGEDIENPLALFDLPAPLSRREAQKQETIEKLSRHGLDLLQQIRNANPSEDIRETIDPVELVLLYAREDYAAAGRTARAVMEGMPIDADEISGWCIRLVIIQCHLAVGDRDLARAALDSLISHPPKGATILDESQPDRDVPLQFRKRIDERLELLMNELAADKRKEETDSP